mgnify:CR=1 FL=1
MHIKVNKGKRDGIKKLIVLKCNRLIIYKIIKCGGRYAKN